MSLLTVLNDKYSPIRNESFMLSCEVKWWTVFTARFEDSSIVKDWVSLLNVPAEVSDDSVIKRCLSHVAISFICKSISILVIWRTFGQNLVDGFELSYIICYKSAKCTKFIFCRYSVSCFFQKSVRLIFSFISKTSF